MTCDGFRGEWAAQRLADLRLLLTRTPPVSRAEIVAATGLTRQRVRDLAVRALGEFPTVTTTDTDHGHVTGHAAPGHVTNTPADRDHDRVTGNATTVTTTAGNGHGGSATTTESVTRPVTDLVTPTVTITGVTTTNHDRPAGALLVTATRLPMTMTMTTAHGSGDPK